MCRYVHARIYIFTCSTMILFCTNRECTSLCAARACRMRFHSDRSALIRAGDINFVSYTWQTFRYGVTIPKSALRRDDDPRWRDVIDMHTIRANDKIYYRTHRNIEVILLKELCSHRENICNIRTKTTENLIIVSTFFLWPKCNLLSKYYRQFCC